MDLARRGDRCWHRAAKCHLAGSARVADLGVAARNRAEQQERRPDAVAVFRAANHVDESSNLSALVRRINLAARFPGRSPLLRHGLRIPNRAGRIYPNARQKLLSRRSVPDAVRRGWRRFRTDIRSAASMAQTGNRRSHSRIRGHSRSGGASNFAAGQAARLHAHDSF